MRKETTEGQSDESIQQNISFFCDNLEDYNKNVQNLDTYVILRSHINKVLTGIDNLLDIGNGGVFDYDVSLVPNIVGLDLFLDKLPSSFARPANVTLKTGSALDIPETNESYDGVLMVMLIHHLVGQDVATTIKNVETAISEAHRVLKPGGKMIIVESCVPSWFYRFEKWVFPLAVKWVDKIMGHPATLQYPVPVLKNMLEKKFGKTQSIKVPLGRWVIIFGKKVPAFLTPVSPTIFIAEKT